MTKAIPLHWSERGNGPPLVILHGLYGSASNWSRHARWLAEHYRVITPDLRNHGDSPHALPMDYPAMAADLERLLDDCGCESATVLGHSMGGKAAMALALQAPQRVQALVVVDIAPVDYGTHNNEHVSILEAMAAVDLEQVTSRRDVDAALADAVPTTMVRQFLLTNLQRGDHGWQWRIPVRDLLSSLPDLMDFPFADVRYNGPTLFLRGAESAHQDDRHAGAVARFFPSAEQATIANAGHWLHVEQADTFAATLKEWLARQT